MKTSQIEITPEFAKHMLDEFNTINRPINRVHVDLLASEMKAGKWKENGDTICVSGKMLIDGQHRLAAICKSGVTIKCLLVEGLDSDAFSTKDAGKRRDGSDTLAAMGEKNYTRIATSVCVVDKYLTGRSTIYVKYSNSDIVNLVKKYPDIRNHVIHDRAISALLPPSLTDSLHYLFSRFDRDLAAEFVSKMASGAGMEIGDPFLVLRNRLVLNQASKAKLPKIYLMAICIKAWNSKRSGKKLSMLRWAAEGEKSPEQFPTII